MNFWSTEYFTPYLCFRCLLLTLSTSLTNTTVRYHQFHGTRSCLTGLNCLCAFQPETSACHPSPATVAADLTRLAQVKGKLTYRCSVLKLSHPRTVNRLVCMIHLHRRSGSHPDLSPGYPGLYVMPFSETVKTRTSDGATATLHGSQLPSWLQYRITQGLEPRRSDRHFPYGKLRNPAESCNHTEEQWKLFP